MGRKGAPGQADPATEAFLKGAAMVEQHPLFGRLVNRGRIQRHDDATVPPNGWARVTSFGSIHVHPKRRGTPEEWAYVLAHCALHLGLGHFREVDDPVAWQAACCCYVARFLRDLKFGRPPVDMLIDVDAFGGQDEERLYAAFRLRGIPPELKGAGASGEGFADMQRMGGGSASDRAENVKGWQSAFTSGLLDAVDSAVEVAAGRKPSMGSGRTQSPGTRARSWFMSSFPLLGSLAASFTLVEDPLVCQRMQIAVAAVDAEAKEIYLNPSAVKDEAEARFVIAHELLHVGLRHQARRMGRDPYLWNIACDYVVNGWLVEMGVGELPSFGALHDPALKGMSAEGIYDLIVTDMRRYRKLATLRGVGLGDMLGEEREWWRTGEGVSLDAFYRRCLAQGLEWHQGEGRGFLPAGLVEEIRALEQPPLDWDVELARWFDAYFSPLEQRRSWLRLSRRQSSTPDIPRPRWVPAESIDDGRTFGVVLDTSGSMDRKLLAKALGAIASYAVARDVPRVRVVFCDAVAYDEGYLSPEDIAGRVRVRGRGGTVLQPGIDLLERAHDFPKDGPLLVITDGACDRLHIRREHAFLLPEGRSLPFAPKGKVFRVS
jgi:predicted metal-dependent peptidase